MDRALAPAARSSSGRWPGDHNMWQGGQFQNALSPIPSTEGGAENEDAEMGEDGEEVKEEEELEEAEEGEAAGEANVAGGQKMPRE